MKTEIVIGSVLSTLATALTKIENTYISLTESGLYTTYISSQTLEKLSSDLEYIRRSKISYEKRNDSGTTHDLYNCVTVCLDRLDLIYRRLATVLGEKADITGQVEDAVKAIKLVQSKFIFDVRGRDTSQNIVDKDGIQHRRNIHIKLDRQKILDAGRLSEID